MTKTGPKTPGYSVFREASAMQLCGTETPLPEQKFNSNSDASRYSLNTSKVEIKTFSGTIDNNDNKNNNDSLLV